jgi:hypothetical protein
MIHVSFAKGKGKGITFTELAINFDIDLAVGLPQLHYGR